ncbi:nuclear transport factor 2 family protein [Algoriphagus boritolerans]|uniref:SnoaL-like domain-containing protein n=1 Tax=Algoriphagus boritolerans DSM 17298 = JCM 18970 TaxID=1120964 RepID=A0A1H5VCJ4_9BACT|nr:nuclear transport factor 2 family protein [Algoriphagus boritolerans]SEF84950.1 SnoaL-like domain-containing protein [Algoriphagus boritolerans DSM 17298 = JCM 18970]
MKTFKTILTSVFLLLLTTLVALAQEVTLEFQNAATALEVVQKYTKALQAGDVATMNAQFASNAMIYGLGGGLDSLTVAQHKEYYTTSTNTYKHSLSQELYLPVKVTNNWNEGEWILTWGTNTLTNKATGKTIVVPYHTAGRVMNGKIVFLRYWYDMLNILETQGFKVTPPAK